MKSDLPIVMELFAIMLMLLVIGMTLKNIEKTLERLVPAKVEGR
jgi:hypothetical protein